MDAMPDRPMKEMIEDLPVSQDIRTALFGGENAMRLALAQNASRPGVRSVRAPHLYAATAARADTLLKT